MSIVGVSRDTYDRLVHLAHQQHETEQQVLRRHCRSLLSRIRCEFETLCSLWYPNEVDPASFQQWRDSLRKVHDTNSSEKLLPLDQDVQDLVTWIAQYAQWPTDVILAEALA